jgi:uncharacterized DUF497 family protein
MRSFGKTGSLIKSKANMAWAWMRLRKYFLASRTSGEHKKVMLREKIYVLLMGTADGRYLIVFFIRKEPRAALPVSARDMTDSERRYYERQAEAD